MDYAVPLAIAIIAVIFIVRSIKVVPQQHAWVKERLGKYAGTLTPGLNFLIPFVDRIAYKHSLKEIPLDVPSQVCITRDNTQLTVDGILYFQVTDPMRASYGSSNYIMAVTQLAQTSLRSVIGKLELDKTFEERDMINAQVVNAIDEAALNWGVKVLRYEIKDLTPSTRRKVKLPPSPPWPKRPDRRWSVWPRPSASPAASRQCSSRWLKAPWRPTARWLRTPTPPWSFPRT